MDGAYVARLRAIEGHVFPSQAQFLQAVRDVGGASSAEVERLVVAHARRLSVRKIARIIRTSYETLVAPSAIALPPGAAFLVRPLPFTVWFRGRAWLFRVLRRLNRRAAVETEPNVNAAGFAHNYKQMLYFFPGHRNRTERLMNVVRTIQGFDPARARVLCVGPRNEAEVLLMRLYGFHRRNIEVIDLFSYSPIIRLMDMNALEYPDDTFDVYYSSAVIKYSPDIALCVAEAVRVTRSGGLMAFGFTYGTPSELGPAGSSLLGGGRELLDLFGEHVAWLYWHEEWRYAEGDIRTTVVFRLRK